MQDVGVATQAAPDFTITLIEFQDGLQVFHGSWEVFFRPEDTRYRIKGLDGLVVVAQGLLVRIKCAIGVSLKLTGTA